jgi:hypothetical protein
MKQRKSHTDGVDREALEEEVKSYFNDKFFSDKILSNSFDLFFFVPVAYNLFVKDSVEFRKFYSERFRKEASDLEQLADQEKYGALLVKARELYNLQSNEDFLNHEYKKIKNLKFPVKQKRSRGVGFGKFSS